MNIKHCTEQFLKDSGLNYTIFRPCGFMQVRGSVPLGWAVLRRVAAWIWAGSFDLGGVF